MRLQKQLSRKVGKKEYPKYVAVIPPKFVEELEWEDGEELDAKVEGKSLLIKKKDPQI
jgi:hypothetical protein